MEKFKSPSSFQLGFEVEGMSPEEAANKSPTFLSTTLVILLPQILPHSEGGAVKKHHGKAEVRLLNERGNDRIGLTLLYLSTLPSQ